MFTVGVITLLRPRSDKPIAAARCHAAIDAGVEVIRVGVVTLFKTLITRFEILADDPVTASGNLAEVGAGVVVNEVSVVAGFSRIDTLIAAVDKASCVASISISLIRVVTLFITLITRFEILPDDPITACGNLAEVGAGVRVN